MQTVCCTCNFPFRRIKFLILFICNSPRFTVITRNFSNFINIYSIVVVVCRIFFRRIFLPQNQLFMTLCNIQICKPADIAKLLNAAIRLQKLFHIRTANPDFIIFQQWEELFVCNRILISNNQKLLLMFH